MRVKLAAGVRMAGPEGTFGPGDVVEVPTATAQILIANGSATAMMPVVDAGAPVEAKAAETATILPPETATAQPQQKILRKKRSE